MLDFNFKTKETKPLKNEKFSHFLEVKGCPFSPRCKRARNFCFFKKPKIQKMENNHFVACHQF
jgi:ABC-type dipeptide/oligopeptide/nickel transport system ATPase component